MTIFDLCKIKESTLLTIVGIKNIFKDRVKPKQAIANLVAKLPDFRQDKTRNKELETDIEKVDRPSGKIQPKRAIANLVAKLPDLSPDKTRNQADFAENNTELNREKVQRTSGKITGKKTIANFVAKLASFSQDETNKKALETDIEKIDRTLIENAIPHKKIIAIFHQIAMNIKPENVDKIAERLPKMNRGSVKQVWTQVQSLLATIGDPNIAWKSKTLAIAALIYLVSPIDAIPDLLPGIGLTDDVALIVAVVSSLAYELGNYVEKSADKGVEIASELADIQVKKYNKIVKLGLIGSILAGIIAILVQFIIKQMP